MKIDAGIFGKTTKPRSITGLGDGSAIQNVTGGNDGQGDRDDI
jgi:hypothetical protein